MPSLVMRQHDYRLGHRCIYCLDIFDPADLTDEHIIPRALNGTLIIRKGACNPCARLSNSLYESAALNTDLLIPRRLLELKKSRNRGQNQKPARPLPPVAAGNKVADPDAVFDAYLTAEQYPGAFSLLVFPPAGRLVGEDRGADLAGFRVQLFFLGESRRRRTNITTRVPHVNGPFARMLAKIAYCYALAELGFDGFDSEHIRDLLCGRRHDVYNFVGSVSAPERLSSKPLHGLYIRRRGNFCTVLVHMFASLQANADQPSIPYEVVVGTVR